LPWLFLSGDSQVGYPYNALLDAAPQIMAAAIIPIISFFVVGYLLKATRPRPGQPVGID
jgi:hypothetical protein